MQEEWPNTGSLAHQCEAIQLFETQATTQPPTQRHIPEHLNSPGKYVVYLTSKRRYSENFRNKIEHVEIIHSVMSYDRSMVSSKAGSPESAI
jgi:hypothetical protein